jgi:hypothetical protein
MNIKPFLTFAFALLLILFNARDSARAQIQVQESIRVYLDVSGDKEIENEVRSYFSRELRGLKNILVVADKQDVSIRVIAHRDKTVGGKPLDNYIMSVVVTAHIHEDTIRNMINIIRTLEAASCGSKENQQSMSERERDNLMTYVKLGLERVFDHLLYTENDLQKLCKVVVATIDGSTLEPYRLMIQERKEFYSSPLKEATRKTPTTPTRTRTMKKP